MRKYNGAAQQRSMTCRQWNKKDAVAGGAERLQAADRWRPGGVEEFA